MMISWFPDDGDFTDFINLHLLPNVPCMFSKRQTDNWKSIQFWQTENSPNLDYLAEKFGEAKVPVADCNIKDLACSKTTWVFRDYVKYWKSVIAGSEDQRLLYLKDWHFVRSFPTYNAYITPLLFMSDLMNEAWHQLTDEKEEERDDYQFVYMGPAGTWTPFHADVFRSYSWSANVCGVKQWLLCQPGEEENLRDKFGNLPEDITSVELQNTSVYPNAHLARPPIVVTQGPGEVIFVPSGWYHQVKNLEHTISINHNWTNSFGVQHVWRYLQSELSLVEAEISDCRSMEGWEAQCQLVLRASAGMDYDDFHRLLTLIGEPRLKQVQNIVAYLSSKNMPTTVQELNDHIIDVFKQCASSTSSVTKDSTASYTLSLKSLTSALPQNLCAVLEQAIHKLRTDHRADAKPQLLAALVYRTYELYQIGIITQELDQSLKQTHSQTKDFVSRLIPIITFSK